MIAAMTLLLCVTSALIGGLYLAFSTSVMPALASRPPAQGVATMQRINVVILNPLFLGIFFGAALLSAACMGVAFFPWQLWRSVLLLAAGCLYLFASFGVTIACNVPRNERLAGMRADSQEAVAYWPIYVREWTRWNHLRACASVASALCAASALSLQ